MFGTEEAITANIKRNPLFKKFQICFVTLENGIQELIDTTEKLIEIQGELSVTEFFASLHAAPLTAILIPLPAGGAMNPNSGVSHGARPRHRLGQNLKLETT